MYEKLILPIIAIIAKLLHVGFKRIFNGIVCRNDVAVAVPCEFAEGCIDFADIEVSANIVSDVTLLLHAYFCQVLMCAFYFLCAAA